MDSINRNTTANPLRWSSKDTGWMMNLFGTAIGAGVLYLPIIAGSGGIWPLIIMALLAGPMVWLAHRNLVRFCLSSSNPNGNITTTVTEHFGPNAGKALTVAYFLSVYPILLLYAIGITNVALSFMETHFGMMPHRALVTGSLTAIMIAVMHLGEKQILNAVKLMVYPLVITLIAISLYLLPQWSLAVFDAPVSVMGTISTLFITTPLLIFSFNHSPSCSAFAHSYRTTLSEEDCSKKTSKILKYNTALLLGVILLFIFSCVLSLTPETLQLARAENLPVLSVLGEGSDSLLLGIIAPAIAFLAICSSFFGVYMGAFEGIQGVFIQQWNQRNIEKPLPQKAMQRAGIAFIFLTCWFAGYVNWDVISMIEIIVVPVLATILYLMPVVALYKVESLRKFRQPVLDAFIFAVGVIAIIGFLAGQLM